MNKKTIIVICATVISILLGLNIYIYSNSAQISQYADQNNYNTQVIVYIDRFKTEINKMAQAQKLYLVTNKEEYLDEYEQSLENVYFTIEEMKKYEVIEESEAQELNIYLEKYDEINEEFMYLKDKDVIDDDIETAILLSNQAQLNILNSLENAVEYTRDSLIEQSETIISKANLQKYGIQVLSTVITVVGSATAYYIKKNPEKLGEKLSSIISYVEDINEGENSNKQDQVIKELLNHEKNLEKIKLINKEANDINQKVKEIDEIVAKIDSKIKDISTEEQGEKIKDIEDEIVELRILLKTLLVYNDVILEVSTNIRKNNIIEKL